MPKDENPAGSVETSLKTPLALAATAPGSAEPALALQAAPPQELPPSGERFEFLEFLGRGGMGEVYKARDRRLNRFLAVKFLRAGYEGSKQRFLQEARAQARIDHENVCKVHEVSELDGKPYIAMELVSGLPLNKVMSQLRLEEKLCILRDAAEALHAAHRLGIVHRDVKPSNLLVQRREDGTWRPVVMDFGLAHDPEAEQHLTQSGAVMGTPAYMSPEQARGDAHNLDRRTDVYALGATLFELLTGRPPFVGSSQAEILLAVLSEEPPSVRTLRPGLPADLDTLVQKCLHKDPLQRYQSARVLSEDIQRYLSGEPIVGRRVSVFSRLRRRAQKHRAAVAVAGLALVGLSALGTYGVQARLQVRREQAATAARAKLSQQLGQSIKEMEWLIRSVHQLPLHDTRYAQAILKARIQKLETMQHGLGNAGEGLVQYALGHAYIARQDFDRAYEHLSEAQRKGNDTPELRGTLGRVLGEQYKQKLEEAQRTGDVGFVKARKQELRKAYIEPAVTLLRGSQGAELGSSQLLDGLIALYSEQYDEALKKAEEAFREAPWLYEAKQLAGDVYFARGLDQRNQTAFDAANKSFELAIEKYKEAAGIGHSDARLYEAIAESYLQWGDIATNLQRRYSETALLKEANAACQNAMQISPDRPHSYSKSSRAYSLLLYVNDALNLPMEDYLHKLLTVARQGLRREPGDAYIYDSIGCGYQHMANYEASHDKNPMANYNLSIENFKIALDKQPQFPISITNLGLTYLRKAYAVPAVTLAFPQAEFDAAIEHFERARALDPQYMPAWNNLLLACSSLIYYSMLAGRDPSILIRKMLKITQDALVRKINFGVVFLQVMKGIQYYADYLILRNVNSDFSDEWERARALAIQIEDSLPVDDKMLPHVRVFRAVAEGYALLSKGQDPSTVLEAGRSSVPACVSAMVGAEKGFQAECHQLASTLSSIAADFAARHGQPALPHLEQAVANQRRAVQLFPLLEYHVQLVRSLLRLAAAQPPRTRPALVMEAQKSIAEGLGQEPGYGELHALRAQFYLLQGKTAATLKQRRDFAQKARDGFGEAVKQNPMLAGAYKDAIAEAASL